MKLRPDGKPPAGVPLPQRDHCLRVNIIIYLWHKARVDLETGKKNVIFYHIEQSRLSTEQFEGAGARRQPSGKQAIVNHHVNGTRMGRMQIVAHYYEHIPDITEEILPQMSPRGHIYRLRPSPMQMFTQPSAPDIQAPNQAISASAGVITP